MKLKTFICLLTMAFCIGTFVACKEDFVTVKLDLSDEEWDNTYSKLEKLNEEGTLYSAEILDGVEEIDFRYLSPIYESNVVRVVIPASVRELSACGWSQLREIIVSPKNEYYMSIAGALYTKNKKELIKCPPAAKNKTFKIPDGVTTIRRVAFGGCQNLTNITISDGVTAIEEYAFLGCQNLTTITIPESVTTIGYGAFEDCQNLTTITFSNPNPENIHFETYLDRIFDGCINLKKVRFPKGSSGRITEQEKWEDLNFGDDKFYTVTVEFY